jgi:hypothetical protein
VYRRCIYCSGRLGSNEVLEGFPVGSTIAFDAGRGRLWAVCPKCSRWNLAPIEERWEVVEAAERTFRDTRLRVQNESVGVAKLPDGTRLVRIGEALPGEIAAWRYGRALMERRRSYLRGAAVVGAVLGVWGASRLARGHDVEVVAFATAWYGFIHWARRTMEAGDTVVHRASVARGGVFRLRAHDMTAARLVPAEGGGFDLHLPQAWWSIASDDPRRGPAGCTIRGVAARNALGRLLAVSNRSGGTRASVASALGRLGEARDAADYLRAAAERETRVAGTGLSLPARRVHRLSLEMALHDEQERRAMEGELALLESAWKEAEAIAGIADGLALGDAPLDGKP